MKISGHKSLTVFEGYNVTSEADIRQGAVKLAAYMAELDENAVLEIGTLLAHWRY